MTSDLIWVRDSKQNDLGEQAQPMLSCDRRAWLTFLAEVLGDAPAGSNGSLFFKQQSGGRSSGGVVVTGADSDVSLHYDAEEWSAFRAGVVDGDFGPVPTAA